MAGTPLGASALQTSMAAIMVSVADLLDLRGVSFLAVREVRGLSNSEVSSLSTSKSGEHKQGSLTAY